MIKVNVEQMIVDCGFNAEEAEIVRLCFKGKKNEAIKELRKSKPKINEIIYENCGRKYRRSEYKTGMAAYIWRMLAFYTCNSHPYCCMPVMADCDLPYCIHDTNYREDKKVQTDLCQVIIDKVLDYVPKNEWQGVIRWGRALGAI